MSLSGMVSRPKANIWHSLQALKYFDSSFSRSRDTSSRVQFKNASGGLDHAHFGDSWPSDG